MFKGYLNTPADQRTQPAKHHVQRSLRSRDSFLAGGSRLICRTLGGTNGDQPWGKVSRPHGQFLIKKPRLVETTTKSSSKMVDLVKRCRCVEIWGVLRSSFLKVRVNQSTSWVHSTSMQDIHRSPIQVTRLRALVTRSTDCSHCFLGEPYQGDCRTRALG